MREELNRLDFQARQVTAMAFSLVIAFTALEFESDHFLIAELLNHLSGDCCTIDEGSTKVNAVTFARSKNFVECDGITDFNIEFLDVNFVAFFNAVLFSAGFNYCVSHLYKVVRFPPDREGGESAISPLFHQVVF